MGFSAALKGVEILKWETFEKPLSAALSTSVQRTLFTLRNEITAELKRLYYVPGNPDKASQVYFKHQGKHIWSAELVYRYKSIPLGRYPTQQYRITTQRKILRVSRGGKFSAANKFTRRVVNRASIATYVQIKKNGPKRLVHGKLGYMGWLHTGRRSGQSGFNGQTNTFAANIFERNQKKTWSGNVRLPIHRLFGPSITELVQGKEVQTFLEKSKTLDKLSNIFADNINR